MMHVRIVADRYAKGLMLALEDKSSVDLIEQQLQALVRAYEDEASNLKPLFQNPACSNIDKKLILNKIADTYGFLLPLRYFLLLLVNKNRFGLLPLILESLRALVDDYHQRKRALLKTSAALNQDVIEEVQSLLIKLSNMKVLLEVKEEPELLAGMRVEMGDLVFDGSAKAMFDALRYSVRAA